MGMCVGGSGKEERRKSSGKSGSDARDPDREGVEEYMFCVFMVDVEVMVDDMTHRAVDAVCGGRKSIGCWWPGWLGQLESLKDTLVVVVVVVLLLRRRSHPTVRTRLHR